MEEILEEIKVLAKYGNHVYRSSIISSYAIIELKKLGFKVSARGESYNEMLSVSWDHLISTDLNIIDTIKFK